MLNNRVRSSSALVAATALCTVMTACGSSSEDTAGGSAAKSASTAATAAAPAPVTKGGKPITIGFGSLFCANPTVCAVEKGFKAEAARLGVKAVVLEGQPATAIQDGITNFNQLVAQKVDAIAIWPLDPKSFNAVLPRAEKAGIPVFAHDLYDSSGTKVVTSVTFGRELVSKQSADLMCEKFPDGGHVLYGDYGLPAPTTVFLRDKFKEYLKACSGGKLAVTAQYGNTPDTVEVARQKAAAALQKDPKIVAAQTYNDANAVGISIAAKTLRRDVFIGGLNLAQDGVDGLKRGRISVSWDYRAPEIGQTLARTMVDYVSGKDKNPPRIIMAWPKCFTPETVSQLASVEDRVKEIAAGTDLLAKEDPTLTQTGDAIPKPGDIAGCKVG